MKVLRYFSISLLAIAILFASAIFLVPIDSYIPEVEAVASSLVGRSVRIRHMKLDLLPAPHLHIEGMSIGQGAGASVGGLEARFNVLALLRSECEISRVEVSHVEISEELLREMIGRMLGRDGGAVGGILCRIRKLDVGDVRLNVPDVPLAGIKGSVSFVGDATPSLITLHVPGFDLTAIMRPTVGGAFHVEASLPTWSPMGMSEVKVEQLRVLGLISASGFEVKEFSGRLLQMGFRGSADLNWANFPEYALHGELDWSGTNVRPTLSVMGGRALTFGRLKGQGRFSSHGATPRQLIDQFLVDADVASAEVSLEPKPQARFPLRLEQFDSQLSYGRGAVHVHHMDARLAGGTLGGMVTWLPGDAVLSFELATVGVDPQALVRMVDEQMLISGVLDAEASGEVDLRRLAEFPAGANVRGQFRMAHGELGQHKLVNAVNSTIERANEDRVHFDKVSGDIRLDGAGYHLSNLSMVTTFFNAEGDLNMNALRQLDGTLEMDVKGTAKLVSLPLRVSGSLDEPSVFPTRGAMAGAAIGTVLLGPGLGTAIGIRAGGLVGRILSGSEATASAVDAGKPQEGRGGVGAEKRARASQKPAVIEKGR